MSNNDLNAKFDSSRSSKISRLDAYVRYWIKSPWWVFLFFLAGGAYLYFGAVVPEIAKRQWSIPRGDQIMTVRGTFIQGLRKATWPYEFQIAGGRRIGLACLPDLGAASCIDNAGYRISEIAGLPSVVEYFYSTGTKLNPSFNFILSVRMGEKDIIRKDNQLADLNRWSIVEDRLHSRFPIFSGSIMLIYIGIVLSGILIKSRELLRLKR